VYLDSVLEQEYPVRFLRLWAEGRVHKPLLLHGPAGVGKSYAAQQAALDYFCPNDRLVVKNQHPDYIVIRGAPSIGIDEIRCLLDSLADYPVMGKRRVCLIDDAAFLTTAAANALLKTLEEDATVLFLLVTSSVDQVIPTIKSRCGLLRFNRLSYETVRSLLTSRGIDRADELARMGNGSIGDALAAWADDHIGMIPRATALMEFLSDKKYRDAFSILDQEKRLDVFLLVLLRLLQTSMFPSIHHYPLTLKPSPEKFLSLEKILYSQTPINKVFHAKTCLL
jgi:DNA polymerase-3 subunit delta'